MQSSDFRFEINALRAFAVLAVMAYHFGVPGFSGGFTGVDVFFVISGFLMASQVLSASERDAFSFASFYSSRLRRIFPALFVVVFVCLVWGWFFDLPKDYINTNRHAVSALFFVSNIAFDGERGYFDAAAHTKSLLHTWSLAVEGQFYIFLPVFLILMQRFAKRYLFLIAGIVLLVGCVWALYINHVTPGKGFYLLSCRIWEFFIGVMLATYQMRKLSAAARNLLGIFGLVFLIGSFCLIDASIPWPGIWTLIPTLAAAMLIAAGNTDLTRKLLGSWPLQRVGDISYSLYLWHWPVWVFSNNLLSMSGRDLNWMDRFGMLLLSFLLAGLSWRFIEQPIRLKRQWWSSKRLVFLALIGAFSVFSFGLANVAMNGMPFRLSVYVQRAAEATFINTPRDECFRRGDSTKDAPEQFCSFGVVGSVDPELALWGDSHANQYLTAVSDAATNINIAGIIATQSACSARKIESKATTISACEKFNQEVYQYISSHATIKTVILGKWWADIDNAPLLTLIRDLVSQGKKVILIGALPSPGFDVPERWSKQQISAGQAIDSMVIPMSSQSPSLAIREKMISELLPLLQAGSVIYIDPFKHLCDYEKCRLVEDGSSNFRDESHLSHSSTMRFMPDFEDAIRKMKARNE
jgi:peptidoglycan/LPS O-acetylase OafA/YrhL